jgi:hypothetical protein
MANLVDARGAFQDVRDELGEQRAPNVRGYAFDQLRRYLYDVVFGGIALCLVPEFDINTDHQLT